MAVKVVGTKLRPPAGVAIRLPVLGFAAIQYRRGQHASVAQLLGGSRWEPPRSGGSTSVVTAAAGVLRARAWLRLGVPELALAAMTDAPASPAGSGPARLIAQRLDLHKHGDAVRLEAEAAVGKRTRRLAQMEAAAGDVHGAVDRMQRFGRTQPLSAWSELWLARWLSQTHQLAAAVDACERALVADPDFVAAHRLRASLVAAASLMGDPTD